MGTKLRIPSPEHRLQISIQDLGPRLQEQVCPFGGPLHLLAFLKAFADDLINRRFHKGCTDDVALAIPFSEVGDELFVIPNVGLKLGYAALQFDGGREAAALNVQVEQQKTRAL